MTLRALYYACNNWGSERTLISLVSNETGIRTLYRNWFILPEEYKSKTLTTFYYDSKTDIIWIYYEEGNDE